PRHPPHPLELLGRLSEPTRLARPLLVGPSRKSFIGRVLDLPAGERLFGTAAAVAAGVLQGADVVRVHDGAASPRARGCSAGPRRWRRACCRARTWCASTTSRRWSRWPGCATPSWVPAWRRQRGGRAR